MDFDYDVSDQTARARTRYNFDQIRPGASLHVQTDAERCRVMAAFKYWTKQRADRREAYATSAKVGSEDPRGPGFRVWFNSRKVDAKRTAGLMDDVPQPQPQGDI